MAEWGDGREPLVTVKVYFEGWGDRNPGLAGECRRGFSEFFRKAGLDGRLPRVVARGSRKSAYDRFCTSVANTTANEVSILLVDSEESLTQTQVWTHVWQRPGDGWVTPPGVTGDRLHLIVQTMEAWFFADVAALGAYRGQGIREQALGQTARVDAICQSDLCDRLQRASAGCGKGSYSKGGHCIQILARIDPTKVREASPEQCGRLIQVLDRLSRR